MHILTMKKWVERMKLFYLIGKSMSSDIGFAPYELISYDCDSSYGAQVSFYGKVGE